MNRAAIPVCAFGPFELDPSEHRLLRDGHPVALTPKVFEVLCVLVRNHGRLVTKEGLLEEVWPDTFVDEANLNRCVSVLRKALGERVGEQRYIETVPKVGYRFVAPVTLDGSGRGARASADPPPTLVTPAPASGIGVSRRVAVALVIAVVAGVLVYAVLRPGVTSPEPPTRTAVENHRQLTFTGQEGLPTISPDGARLAYVSSTSSVKRVMVRTLEGGQPVEILAGSGAGFLRWSPRGDALLFWARTSEWEGVFLSNLLGEAPRRLARGRYVASWSPDGSTIAVASYLVGRISFLDRSGREQRVVTLPENPFWVWDMDWSPRGDRLLLTTSDEGGRFSTWTVRPDGRERLLVMEDHAEIATTRWAPRAEAIYYTRRAGQTVTLFRQPMDGGARRARTEPSAVLTGLETDRAVGITGDGRRLVYARAPYHSNLWRVDLVGSGPDQELRTHQLTTGTSLMERPHVSPDGTSVVFTIGREALANLYSMPIEGGTPRPLTNMDAFSLGGVWSADGTRVAFASAAGGVTRLWTVDAGGGTPRTVFTGAMSDNFDLAWHPGTRILFQQPGNRDFVDLDPERGSIRQLVKDSSVGWIFSPVPSPDGRRVAVMWNRRDGRGIWTIDRGDGHEQLVHPSASESLTPIGWSADGRAIYVVEGKAALYRGPVLPRGETVSGVRILLIDVDQKDARVVATLPFDEIGSVTMTPDGRRFVCTVYSSASDIWMVDLPA